MEVLLWSFKALHPSTTIPQFSNITWPTKQKTKLLVWLNYLWMVILTRLWVLSLILERFPIFPLPLMENTWWVLVVMTSQSIFGKSLPNNSKDWSKRSTKLWVTILSPNFWKVVLKGKPILTSRTSSITLKSVLKMNTPQKPVNWTVWFLLKIYQKWCRLWATTLQRRKSKIWWTK